MSGLVAHDLSGFIGTEEVPDAVDRTATGNSEDAL